MIGDYHTHTVFSHGKHTIEEVVAEAQRKGLRQIAITDHGLNQAAWGLTSKKICEAKKEIDKARKKFPEMDIFFSVEANFSSDDGDIGVPKHLQGEFDFLCAGFHDSINPLKNFSFWFHLGVRSRLCRRESQRFTKALIKAVQTNNICFVTHLNRHEQIDTKQVAQALSDYGVLCELNGKQEHLTQEDADHLLDKGVCFLANSDAHRKQDVGNFDFALKSMQKLGIPEQRVLNTHSKLLEKGQTWTGLKL